MIFQKYILMFNDDNDDSVKYKNSCGNVRYWAC